MMRLYKPLALLGFVIVFLSAIFCPFLKVPIKGNWNLYQVDTAVYLISNGLLGLCVLLFFKRKLQAYRMATWVLLAWVLLAMLLVYLQINNYFGIKFIDGLLAKTLHMKWGWAVLIFGALLLVFSVSKHKEITQKTV